MCNALFQESSYCEQTIDITLTGKYKDRAQVRFVSKLSNTPIEFVFFPKLSMILYDVFFLFLIVRRVKVGSDVPVVIADDLPASVHR